MPPRAKPILPKDLCVYVVEVEDDAVPEDAFILLRQCIMDKVFAENPDHIAIVRSDKSSNVRFLPANWDALRKLDGDFLTKSTSANINPISVLLDVCDYLKIQSKEDSYENKKMLFFGHLKLEDLEEKQVTKLAERLKSQKISTSFVLTDEEAMDARQKKNLSILNEAFNDSSFDDLVYVTSMKKAKKQILNTVSKKTPRATPWNVVMEVGPGIKICVGGYVCTRKNKVGEMKKGLLKDVKPSELASAPRQQRAPERETQGDAQVSNKAGAGAQNKTVVVEVAKNVTEKEEVWKEKNGDAVEKEDVGKGFYYGDKIVPFNELEDEDGYRSGEKCLKLLVFCPQSNIKPAFQQGDGTTLFFPKKQDTESEMKFDALLKAMDRNKRVAIVRKVYLKDKKVNVGVLVPDMERQCLVYSELCFADDVSVPHFAPLIKESPSEEEGITSKEELIDDLIGAMSIDDYFPIEGPVDPAVTQLRASIASKILEEEGKDQKPWLVEDSIDIYFDSHRQLKDDSMQKLKEAFPLVVNKEEGERPSGANIFRKRQREGEQLSGKDEEKKVKLEDDTGSDNAESGIGTTDDKDVDYDDLLDQL